MDNSVHKKTSFREKMRGASGFFILTFLISWGAWGIALIFKPGEEATGLLTLLGAIGPTLSGIILTLLSKDQEEKRDFRRRIFNPTLISWKWYLVILAIFPATYAVSLLIHALTGGDYRLVLDNIGKTIGNPEAIGAFVILNIFLGPLSEELGWRGYALDRLQNRTSALGASLMIGFLWAIWHIPLNYIGIARAETSAFSFEFLMYIVYTMALAVLITWVYNNTNRSILAAFLMHYLANFIPPLWPEELMEQIPLVLTYIQGGVMAVFAACVALIWGQKRPVLSHALSQSPERSEGATEAPVLSEAKGMAISRK
jgi:membrane protease YdiL (CAAX protease family)